MRLANVKPVSIELTVKNNGGEAGDAPATITGVRDGTVVVYSETLTVSDYIHPKVEAEIALVLSRDVQGPGVSLLDASRSIEGAVAAIELVDSRIADWKIKLPDTIADLASAGSSILGSRVVPVDFDLRLTGMVMSRNGERVATGAGAAALGNPVYAVAWLANTLAPFGVTLEAGSFVMTGSLHAAFDVAPGDVVRADFDRLGSVRVRFS